MELVVPGWLARRTDLRLSDKFVLAYIINRQENADVWATEKRDGEVWVRVSLRRIAKDIGLNFKTVEKSVYRLRDMGLIERSGFRGNLPALTRFIGKGGDE